MIYSNARLIFPDGIRDGLEVVVENGKIAEIRERSAADSIDLAGNYLAPGFIDLHIHGAIGRDTMEATPESFRAICDAQRAEFIRDPDAGLLDQLLAFADVIKIVTLAPELPGVLALIDRLRLHKIVVSGGHSDASDMEARAGFEHGMRQVTHTFNAMSSARRRGIYREAGLLEFALSEPDIGCELIADGHHVSPTLMKMLYWAKGPRGICLVTDATAGAGLLEGKEFSLSGRNCVVGNGVCLLADRSALAGSASRMIDLIRVLVNQVNVPLHEAVAMANANPARVLGLKAKGRFEVGADADFVVLTPDWDVARTFVAGEEVFRGQKL
ncbi:MAG: amidohydrolase family protein [Verrucomicrobiaceae bacterium]|nr:amidohydrolase family protein [Verrucomicrobiaceae bacterium]